MKYYVISIFLLLANILHCSNIILINDSPFTLTAVIQSQDGTFLGQKVLQPGEQKNQVSNLGSMSTNLSSPNYAYNVGLTPYSVIWKCANGGYYSVCSSVSPGSLVRASACPGGYYCKPKPKKNKKGKGKCCCCSSEKESD